MKHRSIPTINPDYNIVNDENSQSRQSSLPAQTQQTPDKTTSFAATSNPEETHQECLIRRSARNRREVSRYQAEDFRKQ